MRKADRLFLLVLLAPLAAMAPFVPWPTGLSLAILPLLGAIGGVLGGAGGLIGGIGGATRNDTTELPHVGYQETALANLLSGRSDSELGDETEEQYVARRMQEMQSSFDGSDGIGSTIAQANAAIPGLKAEYAQKKQGAKLSGPLGELSDFVKAGPGMQDVTQSLSSQRGLAEMLRQMAATGGLPSETDIASGTSLAGGLFNARRTALNQQFGDLDQENARLAARLGRDPLDPILRAKLGTTKARMSDSLNAEQSDLATKLSMDLPGRRVGFATSAAGVDAGLAEQASRNRATLLGLGSQLLNSERNFRLGSANRQTTIPGSIGDAVGGFFGGAGAGLKLGTSASQYFGGGQTGGGGTTYDLGHDSGLSTGGYTRSSRYE